MFTSEKTASPTSRSPQCLALTEAEKDYSKARQARGNGDVKEAEKLTFSGDLKIMGAAIRGWSPEIADQFAKDYLNPAKSNNLAVGPQLQEPGAPLRARVLSEVRDSCKIRYIKPAIEF
ncbi:MAG: hypothetical protein R3C68_11835 [Myxococcota bacterium]